MVAPCWSSRHTSRRRRDRSNPACNIAMGLLRARSLGDIWEIATEEALFMAFIQFSLGVAKDIGARRPNLAGPSALVT
jgi:hypothetical protein